MITIQEFKAEYDLISKPGINCIHRIKSERRPNHKSRTARSGRSGCCPPYYDHVFGFRYRTTQQPVLTLQPYFSSAAELQKIKNESREYADKNGVLVSFSLEDAWWNEGVVLIRYERKNFIPKPKARRPFRENRIQKI